MPHDKHNCPVDGECKICGTNPVNDTEFIKEALMVEPFMDEALKTFQDWIDGKVPFHTENYGYTEEDNKHVAARFLDTITARDKRIVDLGAKLKAEHKLYQGKWGFILCPKCNMSLRPQEPPNANTYGWSQMEETIADQTAVIERIGVLVDSRDDEHLCLDAIRKIVRKHLDAGKE